MNTKGEVLLDLASHAAQQAMQRIIDIADTAPKGQEAMVVVLTLALMAVKGEALKGTDPAYSSLYDSVRDTRLKGEIESLKKALAK
jgi:hypothetical protein